MASAVLRPYRRPAGSAQCNRSARRPRRPYGFIQRVPFCSWPPVPCGPAVVEPAADLTAQTFQALLTRWFAECSTQPLVVICDHAKIHHAKGLAPCWAQYGDRGEVWYLPASSPHRNPTERLWNWLKQTVICHAFHPDVAASATRVEKFLAHVATGPEEVRSRLCA